MPAPARAAISSTSLGRNGSIDYLRFIGAIGIIWFHLHLPGYEIALAALPMFVALFVCFGVGRDISSLNKRLLWPWLIWSAIFGVAKVAQALVSGVPIQDEFALWMLLAGPSIHLWFLPFSYIFVLLVHKMRRQTRGHLTIILVPCALWLSDATLPQPFAQWVTVIPAALMGLVLNQLGPRAPRAHLIGWTSVGLAVLMVLAGQQSIALQYAIGISAILLVLAVPTRSTSISRGLAETSFGIYLVHPLIFALVLTALDVTVDVQFALVLGMSGIVAYQMRMMLPRLL